MDIDRAKEKVVKLLRLAKNDAASENEAERALSQAEALMRQFGIEAGELLEGQAPKGFEWGSQFSAYGNKYHQAKTLPKWYSYMAVGVAQFTDTIAKLHSNAAQGVGIGFYGDQGDIVFAVWLVEYLRDTVQRSAADRKDLDRSQREAFRMAMALRLVKRMKELRAERDVAFKASSGTALVVISDKLAQRDAEFGAPSYQKSKTRITDRNAAEAGRAAADKVGFSRPLAGGQAQTRIAA